MIKIFAGLKGSGKTKHLIEMVNAAASTSNGNVICIEKGDKLIHEITHKARLVDVDAYGIDTWKKLYGFICGTLAANYDVTDIFIDSIYKIAPEAKIEGFVTFVQLLTPILEKNNINLVMTASTEVEHIPEPLKKYLD